MLRDYSTVITLYVFLAAAVACGPAVAAHRKNRSVAMWWLLGIALPPVAILLAWYLEPLAEEKRLAARWGRVWSQPRTMLQPRRDWAFLPAVFAVFCLAAVILAFYSVNGKMVAEKRILIKNVWRLGFYFGSGAFLAGMAWLLPKDAVHRKGMLLTGGGLALAALVFALHRPSASMLGAGEIARLDILTYPLALAASIGFIWLAAVYAGRAVRWYVRLGAGLFAGGMAFLQLGFEFVLAWVRATDQDVRQPIGFLRVASRKFDRMQPWAVLCVFLGWVVMLCLHYDLEKRLFRRHTAR